MRSRRSNDQVATVAQRRLELLGAELAAIRAAEPGARPEPPDGDEQGLAPDGPTTAIHAEPAPVALAPVEQPAADAAPGRHIRRRVGPVGLATAWLSDRLPVPLQGRVRLGAAHLSVVAVVVAASLAATAWWAVRAADPGELVPTRTVAGIPSALGSTGSAAAPVAPAELAPATGVVAKEPRAAPGAVASPAGDVVVDVAGRVRRPGIARLAPGSRVVDALESAGGARRGVDLRTLNLARVLVDGEQVLVGVPTLPGVAASAASGPAPVGGDPPAALVNLNTADQPTLESLPGIGPVTAQAILRWRSEHGSFVAVEELLDVSGIGEVTLAELAPLVTL